MRHQTLRVLALAAATTLSFNDWTRGASKTWVSAVSGNWTTAAAWNPVNPPGNGDTAVFTQSSAANYLVNYDNPSTTQVFPVLTLDNTGGGAAQLRTAAGGTVYNVTQARVGDSGAGAWQIGSAAANVELLILGINPAGSGAVSLGAGTLHCTNDMTVGVRGSGAFTQTGGRAQLDDELVLGTIAGGEGVVTLSGGTITTGVQTVIGNFGAATFNHNAGLHSTPELEFALNGGTGVYNLTGGTLSFGSLALRSNGTFNQTGGTITGGTFEHSGGVVTGTLTNNGTYRYNSGTFAGRIVNAGSMVFAADAAFGNGAQNLVNFAVPVGRTLSFSGEGLDHEAGTWTQFGNVDSPTTVVGGGTYNQQGGLHTPTFFLQVGSAVGAGTYNLNNGTLAVSGSANPSITVGFGLPGVLTVGNGFATSADIRVGVTAAGTWNHTGTGDVQADFVSVGASAVAGLYNHNNSSARLDATGVFVSPAGRYTLAAGTLNLLSSLFVDGTFSQTGGVAAVGNVSGIGSVSVFGNGSLTTSRMRVNRVDIGDTARVFTRVNGGTTGLSRVETLFFEDFENLSFFGRWDLNNNDLVVDSDTASLADEYDRTKRYIKSGFASGSWNGTGLNSSAAIAAASTLDRTGLGYVKSADVFTSFPATFVGQTVDDTTVLVRYTLLGDADLDGTVNIGDFAFLASNFNLPRDWRFGDFNYDGTTNIGDFALLASNFNQSLAGDLPRGSTGGVVPEPAGVLAVLVAGVVAGSPRRRVTPRAGRTPR